MEHLGRVILGWNHVILVLGTCFDVVRLLQKGYDVLRLPLVGPAVELRLLAGFEMKKMWLPHVLPLQQPWSWLFAVAS